MSGGAAVKAGGGVEGDHPACTTGSPAGADGEGGKETKTRGSPGIRPAPPLKGLGLDGPGAAGPSFLQESGYWQWNEFSRRLVNALRELG
jgi:hypothetical protein